MKNKFLMALTLAIVLALVMTALALADDISNNIDGTVDTTSEVMSLTTGGPTGTTTLYVVPTSGDGKSGCNLTGSTTLVVSVNSSNTSVATVSPTSVTFTGCGFTQVLTVTPHATGSANITLSQTSNTTLGTFALTTASFTVNVAPPPNTAPVVSVTGVTAGGSYEYGSVPAAGCSATDAQDGGPFTFAATLGSIAGPLSSYGLGSQNATCSYTDSGGLTTSVSAAYSINDTTDPVLTVPADFSVEATGASGAPASYSASATDAVDPAPSVSCSPVSGSTFALGTTTVNCSATDVAGNTANGNFDVTVVDTTAPVVTVPADITTEATGASGAAVSFTASASDLVDGALIPVCSPVSGSTFALGTTLVNCSATDLAGNTGSASFDVTVEDTTPPTLVGMPTDMTVEGNTTGGSNVSFTDPTATDVVDANPSVSCSPASGSFFALGGPHAVTCTATDDSGNSSNDSFDVTVVDTTAPTITFVSRLPAANGSGWNNSDVTVNWSCSDIVGVVSPSATSTVSTEGVAQSTSGTCEDTSGNIASDTQNGISIDKTAPSLTWNIAISNGASFYFGFVPAFPPNPCIAADGLSGPNGCAVTGYATTVGSHTMNATAYDLAGNMYSETRSYTVLGWTLNGFYQPVDMPNPSIVWNTVKNGSTVPLKFEIFAGATELTDTAYILSFSVYAVSCATSAEDAIETLSPTGGTVLRYDSTGGQFIYNWQTPKRAGTCHKIVLTTSDGSTLVAYFKLK